MTETTETTEKRRESRLSPAGLAALLELAAAEMDPDAITAFAETAARLDDRHSIKNKYAIWVQCPDAVQVYGYMEWQQHGRQVRYGQSAIGIFAPLTRRTGTEEKGGEDAKRTPEEKAGKDEKSRERVLHGFKVAWVYDLSQTKPLDCPCPRKGPCTCPPPEPPAPAGTAPPTGDIQDLLDALTEDPDDQ
ncbi:hypothetical protein [Actinomadura sp. K4S16]|uniref:hypothetical protein n=1 Tax=Actinomadura sp. K4S16 TaxID=1316147 RepID=UPI0011ECFF9D|nr:hypothetical protein [Actinomadura sp. K4S16]